MDGNINVVIIDSGLDITHPLLEDIFVSSQSVFINSDLEFIDDITDKIGHGTAVCGIIAKRIKNVMFTIIKIFDYDKPYTTEEQLVCALQYVNDNINCHVIHMSFGILKPSAELKRLCELLYNKGIVLISAFDNAGAISYPAIYAEVIGVQATVNLKKTSEYSYLEYNHSPIILAKGGNQRVAWTGPLYSIKQGSSFSAAHITAIVCAFLQNNISQWQIREQLKKTAITSYEFEDNLDTYKLPFKIKKAVLFPYNKEMHSLINYYKNLSFEIVEVCDSKYTGRIGKRVHSIYNDCEFTVKSIYEIDFGEVDTLILGHIDFLDDITNSSLKQDIMELCLLHNMNVYAFDDTGIEAYQLIFESKGLGFYTPKLTQTQMSKYQMGKLYQMSHPVIGVFGTTSQQGKFTIQLALRNEFQKRGYVVGQMGTEPTSLLFSLDACFPFGYQSNNTLPPEDFIMQLNWIIHKIDIRKPEVDVILVGSQSGTVPMMFNNIGQLPIKQLFFLMASMPDAVILCVNVFDDVVYIQRTILSIENLSDTKVIALALYPCLQSNSWDMMYDEKHKAFNVKKRMNELSAFFNIPVIEIGNEIEIEKLCNICIKYLTED